MSRGFGNAWLAVATTIGAVLAAEGFLWVVAPQPVLRNLLKNTPAMHISDGVLSSRLRPGYAGNFNRPEFTTRVRINSAGFRGPEPATVVTKPKLIVIGDSFTFGHGVNDDEAYPALLQATLADIEVINGGFVGGSSPDMYYAWLQARGEATRVDGLVIGFFLGNDVDLHDQIVWTEVDSTGLPLRFENIESTVIDNYLRPRVTPIGYRFPLLRESHLVHLAGSVYRSIEGLLRKPSSPKPSVFDEDWTPETEANVRLTQRVFEGIIRWTKERSIPLAVVMIPTLQQVDGQFDTRVQGAFARFFDGAEIPVLDLHPAFAGRSELYYAQDQHWRAEGHRAAADTIANWLLQTGFVETIIETYHR